MLYYQAVKIDGFLETFTKNVSVEERYYYRQITRDRVVTIVITHNKDFQKYLLEDYKKKKKVIEIDKETNSFDLNKLGVRYFHLGPGLREDKIFDYVFHTMTYERCLLSLSGINPDLLKSSSEPALLINGPNDQE